jgi:hypothetical protein
MQDYNEIVIFGKSDVGEFIFDELIKGEYKGNICFCDNALYKHDTISNIKCFSPEEAATQYSNALFYVASVFFPNRMKKQLEQIGVKNIVANFPPKLLAAYYNKYAEKKAIPQKIIDNITFNVVNHCNLNCAGCNNFSPLAEKWFADVSVFEKDIKRLSEILNGKLKKFNLMGGEPLLHPKIAEFAAILRKYFHKPILIAITSNGLLASEMPNVFWNVLKENDIIFEMTRYPVNIDYNSIMKSIESKGVKTRWFFYGLELKTTTRYILDLNGGQIPLESFGRCRNGNDNLQLKNGRLYTCSIVAQAEHFNKYFNLNLCLSDEDGIDIYEAKNFDEITKFLASPASFCRYCDLNQRTYDNEYRLSKREITEWVIQ